MYLAWPCVKLHYTVKCKSHEKANSHSNYTGACYSEWPRGFNNCWAMSMRSVTEQYFITALKQQQVKHVSFYVTTQYTSTVKSVSNVLHSCVVLKAYNRAYKANYPTLAITYSKLSWLCMYFSNKCAFNSFNQSDMKLAKVEANTNTQPAATQLLIVNCNTNDFQKKSSGSRHCSEANNTNSLQSYKLWIKQSHLFNHTVTSSIISLTHFAYCYTRPYVNYTEFL